MMSAGRGNTSERRQIVSHYTSRNFSTSLHPLVVSTLTVLSSESIKDYCDSCAPQSVDTYCKMALAFHHLATSAQGHTELPVPMCLSVHCTLH